MIAKPTRPEHGDRVTQRHVPGTRHGEVEAVYPPRLLIDPTEVAVRWNDGSGSIHDARRFTWADETWNLERC